MSLPLAQRLAQGNGTMANAQTGTLRDLALAAATEHDAQQALEETARQMQEARVLAKVLTELTGRAIYATRLPIEVDGLRFVAHTYDGLTYARLLGMCEDCGKEVPSGTIFHRWQLGQLLREFLPADHYCRGAAPRHEPTTEERLLSAMRDLIDERVDHLVSTQDAGL